MPLTDLAIRNAKAGTKPVKMADGGGMYLYVTPVGGKLWRLKYRIAGREKLLAMGGYPEVGLGEARRRREAARAMLAEGKDPSREKKREKLRSLNEAENSFAVIAAEFCDKRKRDGGKARAPATAQRSEYLLSLLKPSIGHIAIADIEPIDILAAVRKIEKKGNLESARRTLQLASAVFRYAVATARLRSDPTRDLRGALTAPTVTHYGAITDPKRVGQLLRVMDGYEGLGWTKQALQIAPHVFVRPGTSALRLSRSTNDTDSQLRDHRIALSCILGMADQRQPMRLYRSHIGTIVRQRCAKRRDAGSLASHGQRPDGGAVGG